MLHDRHWYKIADCLSSSPNACLCWSSVFPQTLLTVTTGEVFSEVYLVIYKVKRSLFRHKMLCYGYTYKQFDKTILTGTHKHKNEANVMKAPLLFTAYRQLVQRKVFSTRPVTCGEGPCRGTTRSDIVTRFSFVLKMRRFLLIFYVLSKNKNQYPFFFI